MSSCRVVVSGLGCQARIGGLNKTKATIEQLPKSPFPVWASFVLVNRFRARSTDRQKVIELAGITGGHTVLELGCGPGFFTEFIAKQAGASGHVISQDVQEQMLFKLKKRMAAFPVSENIELLLAGSSSLGLPDVGVDVIFAANVFEEIAREGETAATAKELFRVLKPGGRLFYGEHRVPQWRITSVIDAFEQAGFSRSEPDENLFFYSAVFHKM